MTVDEVLSAPAEYAHSAEVRSIAPAAVFVLEVDAPMRVEFLCDTNGEQQALVEHVRRDESANELLRRYFAADHDEIVREECHADRLARGSRLQGPRAASRRA